MKTLSRFMVRTLCVLALLLAARPALADGFGSAPGTGGGSTSVTGTGLWYSASGSLNAAAVTITSDITCSALSGNNLPCNVVSISGASPIVITPASLSWTSGTVAPGLTQATPGSVATPASITVAPQLPNGGSGSAAQNTPGSFIVNVGVPGAVGTAGAEAGLQFQRNGAALATIQAQIGQSTTGAVYLGNITPTGTNYTLASAGTSTNLNAPGAGSINIAIAGTTYWQVTTAGQISWLHGSVPSYVQVTQTSDVAVNNMTFQAQNAFATSTTHPTGGNITIQSGAPTTNGGTVASPGNIILNTPAPNSTGAPGYSTVQSGGTSYVSAGQLANGSAFGAIWLGTPAAAPSSTNYALESSNGTNTSLNTSSTINIQISGTTDLVFNSGGLNWGQAVTTQAVIGQTIRSSDATINNLTIQAQSAFATASINTTGGSLFLVAGQGATSNATYNSGSVTAVIQAQSGATQALEGYFNVDRVSGTHVWQFGEEIANSVSSMWAANVSPSSSNYVLKASSSATDLQGTTITLLSGATSVASINATSVKITQPIGGGATTSLQWLDNAAVVACGTGGTVTVTAAQAITPGLVVTSGTLGSNCVIDFGTNATNGWFVLDMTGVTLGASFGVQFKNGTTSSTVFTTATHVDGSTSATVWTRGSNTLAASYFLIPIPDEWLEELPANDTTVTPVVNEAAGWR